MGVEVEVGSDDVAVDDRGCGHEAEKVGLFVDETTGPAVSTSATHNDVADVFDHDAIQIECTVSHVVHVVLQATCVHDIDVQCCATTHLCEQGSIKTAKTLDACEEGCRIEGTIVAIDVDSGTRTVLLDESIDLISKGFDGIVRVTEDH